MFVLFTFLESIISKSEIKPDDELLSLEESNCKH